jgi:peroxiredoxin
MKKSFALVLASTLTAAVAFSTFADDKKAPATDTKQTGDHAGHKHDAKAEGEKKTAVTKAEVGKAAPNFTLKTTEGKEWSLSDAKGKTIVLEWCNPDCPACQGVSSDGTVAKMLTDLKAIDSNVVVVFINSSAASPSSLEKTGAYLKDHKIEVPALLDTEGSVGMMYGARTTPHCYVIDDKGVLRYTGAINDAKGGKKAEMNYVVNAVKQIKAGETVSPDTTTPYGCSVKYKK